MFKTLTLNINLQNNTDGLTKICKRHMFTLQGIKMLKKQPLPNVCNKDKILCILENTIKNKEITNKQELINLIYNQFENNHIKDIDIAQKVLFNNTSIFRRRDFKNLLIDKNKIIILDESHIENISFINEIFCVNKLIEKDFDLIDTIYITSKKSNLITNMKICSFHEDIENLTGQKNPDLIIVLKNKKIILTDVKLSLKDYAQDNISIYCYTEENKFNLENLEKFFNLRSEFFQEQLKNDNLNLQLKESYLNLNEICKSTNYNLLQKLDFYNKQYFLEKLKYNVVSSSLYVEHKFKMTTQSNLIFDESEIGEFKLYSDFADYLEKRYAFSEKSNLFKICLEKI